MEQHVLYDCSSEVFFGLPVVILVVSLTFTMISLLVSIAGYLQKNSQSRKVCFAICTGTLCLGVFTVSWFIGHWQPILFLLMGLLGLQKTEFKFEGLIIGSVGVVLFSGLMGLGEYGEYRDTVFCYQEGMYTEVTGTIEQYESYSGKEKFMLDGKEFYVINGTYGYSYEKTGIILADGMQVKLRYNDRTTAEYILYIEEIIV